MLDSALVSSALMPSSQTSPRVAMVVSGFTSPSSAMNRVFSRLFRFASAVPLDVPEAETCRVVPSMSRQRV